MKSAKKIKEKKSRRTYSALYFHQKPKVKKLFHSLQGLSLYRVPNKVKYQHTLKKALYKEGKSGKKGKKKPKSQNMEGENFALAKISHQGAKILYRDAKNLLQLIFCSSSAYDFESVKLVLTQILYAWVDPTNLILIACKN